MDCEEFKFGQFSSFTQKANSLFYLVRVINWNNFHELNSMNQCWAWVNRKCLYIINAKYSKRVLIIWYWEMKENPKLKPNVFTKFPQFKISRNGKLLGKLALHLRCGMVGCAGKWTYFDKVWHSILMLI